MIHGLGICKTATLIHTRQADSIERNFLWLQCEFHPSLCQETIDSMEQSPYAEVSHIWSKNACHLWDPIGNYVHRDYSSWTRTIRFCAPRTPEYEVILYVQIFQNQNYWQVSHVSPSVLHAPAVSFSVGSFMEGGQLMGSYFLEIECSHWPATDLWKNSLIPNTSKIRPTVYGLPRCTYIQIQFQKPLFLIRERGGGLKSQNLEIDFSKLSIILKYWVLSEFLPRFMERWFAYVDRDEGRRKTCYTKQIHLVCLSVSSLTLSWNRFLLDVVWEVGVWGRNCSVFVASPV
jgi:hypothetical protein